MGSEGRFLEIPCEKGDSEVTERGASGAPLALFSGTGFRWDVQMTSGSFCLTPTGRLSLLQALDQAKASPRSLPLSISPPYDPGGEVRSLPRPLAPGRPAFPGAPSPVTSSKQGVTGL